MNSVEVMTESPSLPDWARELIVLYESNAISQFILSGNVSDRLLLPFGSQDSLGSLADFLKEILLPRFDVIITYDLGNGIRIERGEEIIAKWPDRTLFYSPGPDPLTAIESLTRFFRYCINLLKLEGTRHHVGCIIESAQLAAPSVPYGGGNALSALTLLLRSWAEESSFTDYSMATFLITENLNDLNPLLVNNPRAARITVPLPSPVEVERTMKVCAGACPIALSSYQGRFREPAEQLAGATLSSIERLLKIKQHRKESLSPADLARLKKELVENDCSGLIEFVESKKTLEDVYGMEKVKAWLRQDIALWEKGDLEALPMGYLFCGPVGTGKTFLVNCLAGEAGVPVVKFKNFRDKWVGSSESNLEKIFRLLHALGRCIVFVDEADQALGSRGAGSGDSGVSGRIYSMMAEEMSNTRNRGKTLWILASSRPDLIEVDLKRPGRVDVKIPLFPTLSAEESFRLIRALCKARGLELGEGEREKLKSAIPLLLTPGAAEALAVKVYRLVKTEKLEPWAALEMCLSDYQNPIPPEVMKFQISLAAAEASYLDFVPEEFRKLRT